MLQLLSTLPGSTMGRKITKIIIHHSGNHDTPKKIRELHVKEYGWEDIGYHYMISRTGRIIKGRDEEKTGAHAKGENKESIGICLLGNLDEKEPTKEQITSLKKLIKELSKKHPIKTIKEHREVKGVKKSCPGKKYDKKITEEIRKEISKEIRK